MLAKINLDSRICEIELDSIKTQTYREFIKQSEVEFGLKPRDLDNMSTTQLSEYLDFLDFLWAK
ncbi:hypothetical protein [Neobacillus niacini]|uniref:hypothetical protein n=1 Tax=Neobacillus niacini TaxID=86668 RepID=UPI00285D0E02|nr:hypothetical protein [Neobacillus niacini]MDR6999603.1 hypothetical protein [Neobacillus niacini]